MLQQIWINIVSGTIKNTILLAFIKGSTVQDVQNMIIKFSAF